MLDEILNRGRRRIVAGRMLAAGALAGVVSLTLLTLLLILGTRILDWWLPAVVSAIVFLAAALRSWWEAPRREAMARILDQRCSLADTLGTAVHFQSSREEVAAAQRRQAEARAAGIDLRQSLPIPFPRSAYALAALAVTAAGLFLYRFGTEGRLDLSVPMAHVRIDALGEALGLVPNRRVDKRVATDRPQGQLPPESAVHRLGTSTSDDPQERDGPGPAGAAVTAESAKAKSDPESGSSAQGKKTGGPPEASDTQQPGAAAPKQAGDQPPSTRDGAAQNAQASSKTAGTPDSAGLMSKLRDAVSSLMAKMKPQGNQPPPTGAQPAQQPNAKPASGQQNAAPSGKPDANGKPSDQEGQESAAAEDDQMAPGKGAGKSSNQNTSAKPGSGMGHQDGSKELKDAEQLKAMGKLSEIIGKRSASVTGEMTIEPQDGPQQLKTGYSRATATHGEAAGDVNRDEVPMALQGYVQQYYEQVRKQPAPQTKTAN